jgi:uncharacterized membrane protein YoaK (UPF0700 family)
MGLQSATLRRIGQLHVRTTYISGVLTNLVQGLVQQLVRRGEQRDFGVQVYGAVWIGYLVGAILGGVGYAQTGALGMLLPIIGLGFACAFDLRHPHELAAEFEAADDEAHSLQHSP